MSELERAIKDTLALTDLCPNDQTNETLSRLVACVTHPEATLDGISPEVQAEVRRLAAEAEGHMERHWSERVAFSPSPRTEAKEFWYWDNYEELTRHEMELLRDTGLALGGVRRVAMVGSGPLPMTALHMANYMPDAEFTHIDNDPIAVDLGENFLRALGNRGRYLSADGAEAPLTGTYDLAFVAALAGETPSEKQAIVNTLARHLSGEGRLLVRGARGARGLLYPVFPAAALTGVNVLSEYHPENDTINSVFVYGKE